MQDNDNFSDEDIRRMQEELLQSDARLKEVGGPSTQQAETIMKQVSDREAGKHVFSPTTDDRSVYVTNLPVGANGGYTTTHEDLSNFFSECGQILTLTLLSDRRTGLPKGAAYIEFATFEGQGRALDTKQNALFHGHALKVEKKRSFFRPGGGAPRGRGGSYGMMPGAAGGADAMQAMLAMMMAAAGRAAGMGAPMMGGGGRGGYGRGRGGYGRGAGGGFNANTTDAFGGSGSGASTPFGGGASSTAPQQGFGNSSASSPFGNTNASLFGGGQNNNAFQ